MRILLATLPTRYAISMTQPLSITYLVSYLLNSNVIGESEIVLRDMGLHLREMALSGINIRKSYDLVVKSVTEEILKCKCDIIGLSVYGTNARFTRRIIAEIRTRSEACIIIGGPFPTLSPRALEFTGADVAVIGEGEVTLFELISNLKRGVSDKVNGTAYIDRDSGCKVTNAPREFISNLDDLPFPKFKLLPTLAEYQPYDREKSLPIITSRGCIFNCRFCAERVMWGKRVRLRTNDNVIAEIERDVNTFGVRRLNFYDSTFTVIRERTIDLMKKIVDRKLNEALNFSAMTRVDRVDPELLRLMKNAGFDEILFGLETIIPASINFARKGYDDRVTKPYVKKLVRLCVKIGIQPGVAFIFGFPNETRIDMIKEIDFIKELRQLGAGVYVHLLSPEVGSDLYLDYKNDLVSNPTWYREYGRLFDKEPDELIPEIDCDAFLVRPKNISIDHLTELLYCAQAAASNLEPEGVYL